MLDLIRHTDMNKTLDSGLRRNDERYWENIIL